MPHEIHPYDNTSWFSRQKTAVKQELLKYLYYKIKCLDPGASFAMPGRLITHPDEHFIHPAPERYDAFSEEMVIKNLWSGVYKGPNNWVQHNFTTEYVVPAYNDAVSSLVLVGKDKMFYIATDGHIHGYVYAAVDKVWFFVNVSYSAQTNHGQPMSIQELAKSDLVASPDGDMLLYIGQDGYIYGYNIIHMWNYKFFSFMQGDMISQSIKAVGSLIFPQRDRIYYIATYYIGSSPSFDDETRVHGFIRSGRGWSTISPTYAAAGIHGQRILGQSKAGGALTYVKDTPYDRIYYRDIFGLLSYYEVRSPGDYYWAACPGNFDLYAQHLKIIGNLAVHKSGSETKIYFIGHYRYGSDNLAYVHCLVYNGSTWHTVSPSYSAELYTGTPVRDQAQSYHEPCIAVSPDGRTIAYFGNSPRLYGITVICYFYFDGSNYYYHRASDAELYKKNSLQFSDAGTMFYADAAYGNIHLLKYEEAYCENKAIANYEM